MTNARQIGFLLLLSTIACSDAGETRFKSTSDRQDLQRQQGKTCAAKSNTKLYASNLLSSQQQLLVFEFPDGGMGGHGKIVGKRKLDTLTAPQCGQLEFEKCAGVQFYEDISWDHQTFIVTPSTPQNNKVVACALKNLQGHFNIGFSGSDPKEFGRLNEEPFKHLHSQPENTNAPIH